MKSDYFQYCVADRLFYDAPENRMADRAAYSRPPAPADGQWATSEDHPWVHYRRQGAGLPAQGWKIHVSARLESAQKTLDITSDYCIEKGISFKFLIHETAFLWRNAKYADRSASGKFITVYPSSDEELHAALDELTQRLHGLGGPYILSDLRWNDGPLYLRYGGFTRRYVRDEQGEPVPAIEDPQGRLCPDLRRPVFSCPDWVRPPEFLRPLVEERRSGHPPEAFPYVITSALHHSNGGGVYLAHARTGGAQVVVKEARPHAALDPLGRDAVARLRHEHDILARLADVEEVIGVRGRFTAWEHEFLVQEYAAGGTLSREMVRRHPLIHPDPDDTGNADYTRWVLGVTDQVERAVARLHDRGVAFGDLHTRNVLLRDDGRIALGDFELATAGGDRPHTAMGAPGFTPPDRRGAYAADRYALGCLKIALFLPLTTLLSLDTGRARALVETIGRLFDVPADWGGNVLADLDLGPAPWAGTARQMARSSALISGALISGAARRPAPRDGGPEARGGPDWPAIEASIARAIRASAAPERTDRLFPGDIAQFTVSGLGLAHGAAGVLYALSVAGHGRPTDPEEWAVWTGWLLRRVREHRRPHRLGFFDGLHGIAYALEEIGLREDALDILEAADRHERGAVMPDSLAAGSSGTALNRVHFSRRLGDRGLLDAAVEDAQRIADGYAEGGEPSGRGPAGLLRGPSGHALLFIHLHRETGDSGYLDLAQRALERDLRSCVHRATDDTLSVHDGRRTLPYLADGSAGIGLVLGEFLRHRDSEVFATALDRIRRAAQPAFCVLPALFQGAAGLLGFLAHLRYPGENDERLEEQIGLRRDRLRWHMVGLRGEIAVPGDQLLRLSMDLATGAAGVLLGLAAVRDDRLPVLPFVSRSADSAPGGRRHREPRPEADDEGGTRPHPTRER
ncbi:hypothetical protein HNR23_001550 [Nocardiopsis mwathae]|uniref:non-specific serine/threonine protein kinase n=1 Tax=Nocardiopsis mwathae TaxID=1472723 RepID=A0A7W9YG09_9ACTN|nr:class III lanthionine synthetase LanKC [Nocardiopsis mwathae]MBB6171490.1 hypothetical protein [Nocardiopsis mwathae]